MLRVKNERERERENNKSKQESRAEREGAQEREGRKGQTNRLLVDKGSMWVLPHGVRPGRLFKVFWTPGPQHCIRRGDRGATVAASKA